MIFAFPVASSVHEHVLTAEYTSPSTSSTSGPAYADLPPGYDA